MEHVGGVRIRQGDTGGREAEASGKVLRDAPRAYQLPEDPTNPAFDHPAAKEDLNVRAWKHYQPRFPAIYDDDRDLQGRPIRGGDGLFYPVYKIGYIGDVFVPGGPGQQAIMIPGPVIAEQRQKAREVLRQAAKIQVVFVIDATFSMDDWFSDENQGKVGRVETIVRQIMKATQDLRDEEFKVGQSQLRPSVEFSMNFYRDREDGELAFESNGFLGAADALRILNKQKAIGGGKPFEAVFYGLSQALDRVKFDDFATKLVILIGDSGNYPEDDLTADKTAEQFFHGRQRRWIVFFAVVVGINENDNNRRSPGKHSKLADSHPWSSTSGATNERLDEGISFSRTATRDESAASRLRPGSGNRHPGPRLVSLHFESTTSSGSIKGHTRSAGQPPISGEQERPRSASSSITGRTLGDPASRIVGVATGPARRPTLPDGLDRALRSAGARCRCFPESCPCPGRRIWSSGWVSFSTWLATGVPSQMQTTWTRALQEMTHEKIQI